MNWVKIIESVSKMLFSHAKSIILIGTLVLVGMLIYGGGEMIKHFSDAKTTAFVWMYFITALISFVVIGVVLFLANQD